MEDIENLRDAAAPVPVEDHIKLTEQTVLLLGQASNSILYSRRLQILKTLIKDSKIANNILKEKADLLQKGDQNLFGKKFRLHVVETECAKKKNLEIFSGGSLSTPPPAEKPFRTGPSPNNNNRIVKGDFTTVKNPIIETDIAHNMVGNKTTNGTVVSQVSKVLDQSLAPLSRKFLELSPEESLTNVNSLVKYLFPKKISNLQLAGRLAHFSMNWKKLTQD